MKNESLLIFVLFFIFSNSLFAANIFWDGEASTNAWEDALNWSGNALPGTGDKVIIASNATVILSSNVTIQGIVIGPDGTTGTGSLTIAAGFTLTTTQNASEGSDGVHLFTGALGAENILIVNGTLNISGCTNDGIDINQYTSLTIGTTGSITITSPGNDGIEIAGAFSNSGTVTITSPGATVAGIDASSLSTTLINNSIGTISISGGGLYGIKTSKDLTNNGIISISGTSSEIFLGSGDLMNNGTFKGNGTVDGNDFFSGTSSRIAPGTSTGILSFVNSATQDLSDLYFDIEINGATTPGTDYDQVTISNNVDISNAVLNLIEGAYVPVSGDVFTIIDVAVGGNLTGTFNGILEDGTIVFNGVTLYISYSGGDGNDVTASFDSPLPVELISFNAREMEGDVKLSWASANEVNNDYYTLERSQDGRSFEAIAMVNGNGNTTEISNYTHMDKNPEAGLNYYRLKQTDFDGRFSYSDIKTVEFKNNETIKIYPTLVTRILTVETGGKFDGDVTIIIRDLTGRDYKSFQIPSKSNKMELSLDDLVPGSYYVVISNNETIQTQRIVKL